MSQSTRRWTTADLDLLPDTDERYEIIDGELLVTRSPHWNHQKLCLRLGSALDAWCLGTGRGQTGLAPGVIFNDTNAVIPDVTWISQARYEVGLDAAGHLTVAPELVVEVLSEGTGNIRRDRDLKLRLYSARGVAEYWIVDWRLQQIEIYRRVQAKLVLVETLYEGDDLTSPLLPGFTCSLHQLFQ